MGHPLELGASRAGEGISVHAARMGCPLELGASRAGESITVHADRKGEPMKLRCGLVCTVGQAAYLRVEPDVIWLIPDSAEVVVYSNVSWKIE